MFSNSLLVISNHRTSGGGFPCPIQFNIEPVELVNSSKTGGSSRKDGPCICDDGKPKARNIQIKHIFIFSSTYSLFHFLYILMYQFYFEKFNFSVIKKLFLKRIKKFIVPMSVLLECVKYIKKKVLE